MTTSFADLVRSPRGRIWAAAVVAVVLVVAFYARSCSGDFLWDDDAHITANPTIVGPLGLWDIWTSAAANYFPLTMTTFWLEHAVWGLNPYAYHLVGILFHAGSAILLWRVLVRLGVPGAWLGAMLWALHPVQVESVAWICELKNTQSGFFYLLAILWFLRWLQAGRPLRANLAYAIAIACAAAAILSKASTVMLPVVLFLVAWWLGERRWRDAVWLVPFLAISAVASGWTIWEQRVHSMASGPEWDQSLAERCVIAGRAIWFYLGKLAWPHPLIFIYPRWDVKASSLLAWIPLVVAIAAGIWLWRKREGGLKPVALAAGYFVVSLFPVLGFFNVFFFLYSFVSDHFQYLASMGPLALAGAGVAVGTRRLSESAGAGLVAAGAVLLGVLGVLTWRQTGIYQNQLVLWGDTVARNPNTWIGRMNLGVQLVNTGHPGDAIPNYEAALQMKPGDPLAEANLGAAYVQLGRAAEAQAHLETAVKLKPDLAEAHSTLGVAFNAQGKKDQARAQFEEAVRLRPEFETAQLNLAGLLMQTGRNQEAWDRLQAAAQALPRSAAIQATMGRLLTAAGQVDAGAQHFVTATQLDPRNFEAWLALAQYFIEHNRLGDAAQSVNTALQLQPNSPPAHYFAGNVLLLTGHPADALPHLEYAARNQPDNADAQSNYGGALYQSGRPADAVAPYQAALKLKPGDAGLHNNLASALMQSGRLAEALEEYQKALQISPDYMEARFNYALALNAAGRLADARQQCEIILKAKPDHAPAMALLQDLAKRATK